MDVLNAQYDEKKIKKHLQSIVDIRILVIKNVGIWRRKVKMKNNDQDDQDFLQSSI